MKNIYYFNKFLKFKIKDVKLLDIRDFNYQNFIDYPILVKDKQKLNEFLLDNGIEVRYIYYRNCEKIFKTKQFKCKNSNLYEEQLICLPNHQKVNFDYIDKMVSYIQIFLKQNK